MYRYHWSPPDNHMCEKQQWIRYRTHWELKKVYQWQGTRDQQSRQKKQKCPSRAVGWGRTFSEWTIWVLHASTAPKYITILEQERTLEVIGSHLRPFPILQWSWWSDKTIAAKNYNPRSLGRSNDHVKILCLRRLRKVKINVMAFTHVNLYFPKNVLLWNTSFSDEVRYIGHYDKT